MPVQEVPLNFENLKNLNEGRIDKLLKTHLARAAQDCIDRPADKTAREVIMKFTFKPEFDTQTQEAETASCEIECKTRVPVYRTKKFQMRLSNKGFMYNADFPNAIDQPPLPFENGGADLQ